MVGWYDGAALGTDDVGSYVGANVCVGSGEIVGLCEGAGVGWSAGLDGVGS